MESGELERDLKTLRRVGLRDSASHPLPDLRRETARIMGLQSVEVVNRSHLENVLRRAIAQFEGGELGEAAEILFGLQNQVRGYRPPELRRHATALFYNNSSPADVDAFRKRYEDSRIMPELAAIIVELPDGVPRRSLERADPSWGAVVSAADVLTIREQEHLLPPESLTPLARMLWAQQTADCQAYLHGLSVGHLMVDTRNRLTDYLVMMTRAANHELISVDFIDIVRWFEERDFIDYLDFQLSRVRAREVRLTRLRFVTNEEIEGGHKTNLLRQFIRLHDNVGARLELCPYQDGSISLRGLFFPRLGALFVDPAHTPAFLACRINDEELIDKGDLYLGSTPEIARYMRDLEAMLEIINRRDLTSMVKSSLPDPLPPEL